jgi:small subunit ribosomal protein S6
VTRDYELGVIFNPEVNEEQTRPVFDRIEQIVANHSGQITRVNQWGRRRLAYPINHHRDGLYVFIDMVLTPETVSEIERTLKVSEIVLRYMTQKRDPKAVQREREEREARAAAAAAAAANAPTQEAPESETATPQTDEQAPAPVAAEETPVVTPEEVVETPADDVVTPEETVTTPAAVETTESTEPAATPEQADNADTTNSETTIEA